MPATKNRNDHGLRNQRDRLRDSAADYIHIEQEGN